MSSKSKDKRSIIKNKGITSSTLKIIAIIIMFIDHFAAIIISESVKHIGNNYSYIEYKEIYERVVNLYYVMRIVGRIAFPIFIFLMLEGIRYTRNKYKYLLRMFIFAIISEVPFALAIRGEITGFSATNVFFTLTIGLAICIIIEKLLDKKKKWTIIIILVVVAIGEYVAYILNTDYSYLGVFAIVAGFIAKSFIANNNKHINGISCEKTSQIVCAITICLVLFLSQGIERFCVLSLIPICLYNGDRGIRLKYFFYAFYPLHLLILVGLRYLMF